MRREMIRVKKGLEELTYEARVVKVRKEKKEMIRAKRALEELNYNKVKRRAFVARRG